ncbi:MAG TPA: MarR family transcriptional regulator [Burkholderiales bacterium]|nr:MarR family transcriptional regulator [Burkholderiales bacterium]
MAARLELRVGPPADALDRFEAVWNRRAEGRAPEPFHVLLVEDLPLLTRLLTSARWALLERLRKEGPLSIYELARRLGRNYKNVHTDVTRLAELGLVERPSETLVAVTWDAVRAELRL